MDTILLDIENLETMLKDQREFNLICIEILK